MFYDNIVKLLKELNVEGIDAIAHDAHTITFQFEDSPIYVTDTPPGIELSTVIGPVPQEHKEALFTNLLRGNLLGQATRHASLGLDEEGTHVVLSSSIQTIQSYREFRDAIEDFINALTFWKKEVSQEP